MAVRGPLMVASITAGAVWFTDTNEPADARAHEFGLETPVAHAVERRARFSAGVVARPEVVGSWQLTRAPGRFVLQWTRSYPASSITELARRSTA
jgi:hypothetical protein